MHLSSILPNQSFFETYAEGVLITQSDDTILFVNHAFTKLLGYEAVDVNSFNLKSVFAELLRLDTNELERGNHSNARLTKKGGSIGSFKVSISPLRLLDGSDAKVYTVTSYERDESFKSLWAESEVRFAALADALPIMVWMTDQDDKCFYFNKAWLDFTGKKYEEEIDSGWVKGIHPDDMNSFQAINHLLKKHEEYSCEYRLRRKDGNYCSIQEIGIPRFLGDGSFAGYVGSCLDISPMKEAKQELDAQTKELKRSNEELEEFAYVASHDMQEPLRLISSYVQLMQRNIHTGNLEEGNVFMKYITESVSRMQSLINDLLQYSRVNRKGSEFSPVDLNEVLSVAVTYLTQRIQENEATVTYDFMPEVNGDQSQLIRLFQNFIDNAIKFKAPERKPIIHISVSEKEKKYEFAISDNGIGIDRKFHNRIFVIFQRLHTRSEFEGTGIGLSVCKKIVERHGGEISVDSEVGKGTTFYFTLKK